MAGLSQGRSYHRQLFDIFDFSEDDSLFAEDVEEDESAGDQDMNEGGIKAVANTNAIEEGPLTGMLFPCISTMFNFYKEHARLKGFSVFKRSAVNVRGGSRKYQTISCDKGRKAIGAKSSKRINCPIKINAILRENGMWQISKVISSHNHELEPSMSRLMVAHRSLNMDMKRRLEANDIAGIRPAKSIRLLEVQSGGPKNLSCLSKDCRNFIEQKRRLRLGDGDVEAIRKLFVRMLSNVLWVHPRSRAAYEEFNDVVSFDTTYLVNRYKLPFATIVGVNHHGQSILLGCALISHEDVNTFKWLFMTWLEAMEDVHPNSILTDQCESMRKAIREPTEEGRREADNELGIERHKIMEKSIINNWFHREFVYDVDYRENGQYFSCNWHPHMTEEFEKYREMERLFQEASDLAYDDNKIKFVKQRLAELKWDLLSWNDGMIAPTSNA
ncbi:protein FAR-RED IMPAIRED RESPONSE 1-like [Hevea brasiliensis]|uniref:protein FAR-RED IMPAIRED RESPONSE 1-like n=1 Tax=Hevea brasiliensis TaxID=3981 RepID=UPI0025CF7A7C|nr:protein FAR-RED IMPAIRED RESPONSE 1-like [Hevea brasiliensis]